MLEHDSPLIHKPNGLKMYFVGERVVKEDLLSLPKISANRLVGAFNQFKFWQKKMDFRKGRKL